MNQKDMERIKKSPWTFLGVVGFILGIVTKRYYFSILGFNLIALIGLDQYKREVKRKAETTANKDKTKEVN